MKKEMPVISLRLLGKTFRVFTYETLLRGKKGVALASRGVKGTRDALLKYRDYQDANLSSQIQNTRVQIMRENQKLDLERARNELRELRKHRSNGFF